jgi:hypothetical protein
MAGVQYPVRGFAGLGAVAPAPAGKVQGLKVELTGMTKRPVTKAEISTILNPLFKEHQFEVLKVGFMEDNAPVWVWSWDAANKVWVARVMSGPFNGQEGAVVASDKPPTAEDTADLPRALWAYTAVMRPTNLELPESKVGLVRDAVRKSLNPLRNVVGGINTRTVVVAVDPPEKKGIAPVLGTAALIGIALTALSLGSAG